MSALGRLHSEFGQSPWLDNLDRRWLNPEGMQRWVRRGVRGITSNPAIFNSAMKSALYDDDLALQAAAGAETDSVYWDLVVADVATAMQGLMPVWEESQGEDGYVSVEVSPARAHDTEGTVADALALRARFDGPNVMIKVPATEAGIPAIRRLTAAGVSVNATLVFSIDRHQAVAEAYLDGLEEFIAGGGDATTVASVSSFFISRIDTAVDPLLVAAGRAELQGTAAIAQAHAAYDLSVLAHSGPRWSSLAASGARPQRPLWASTSTKNPAYSDTLYVDTLIGPRTVNTLPVDTLEAFDDHGELERTVDRDPELWAQRWAVVQDMCDMATISAQLEADGVDAFAKSYDEILVDLQRRLAVHAPR